jgi:hypothetical protein
VPTTVAGFYITLGLSRIRGPPSIWSDVFAVIGAICIGGTTFVRVAAMAGGPQASQQAEAQKSWFEERQVRSTG